MDTPSENNSDEELADLMADPDLVESGESSEDDESIPVEVRIPPALNDENVEVDSSEETFSINDFEEDFQPKGSSIETEDQQKVEDVDEKNESVEIPATVKAESNMPASSSSTAQNGGGDVAEFRQTLASLSRQLELDRLAFLHKSLQEQGEKVPSLNDIASDITGKKLLKPVGDCDHYGKRPSTRFEGWVSGLSFGVTKRAKKFSK